jgi:hypothetical protein
MKSCKFGPKCNKASDAEHRSRFAHPWLDKEAGEEVVANPDSAGVTKTSSKRRKNRPGKRERDAAHGAAVAVEDAASQMKRPAVEEDVNEDREDALEKEEEQAATPDARAEPEGAVAKAGAGLKKSKSGKREREGAGPAGKGDNAATVDPALASLLEQAWDQPAFVLPSFSPPSLRKRVKGKGTANAPPAAKSAASVPAAAAPAADAASDANSYREVFGAEAKGTVALKTEYQLGVGSFHLNPNHLHALVAAVLGSGTNHAKSPFVISHGSLLRKCVVLSYTGLTVTTLEQHHPDLSPAIKELFPQCAMLMCPGSASKAYHMAPLVLRTTLSSKKKDKDKVKKKKKRVDLSELIMSQVSGEVGWGVVSI